MRRILKISFLVILLVLVVAIGWGGWYVNRKGFTRPWRQYLNAEFEKRGFSVSVSRLTLDPFHGLVARDVEIYDVKDKTRKLAVISQIVLDIDYSHLLHKQPFLNGVDLRNTKITLPVDPSDPSSPRVQISNLNALVLMPPHLLDIRKADANIYGIHVSLSGQMTYPEEFRLPTGEKSDAKRNTEWITGFVNRILALKFESGAPQLDIDFKGNAREPEKFFAEATLRCEKVRHENYQLEDVQCVLKYQDGVVSLKKCVATDNGGSLDAGGKWIPATGKGDFQLRSTLDVQKISYAFKFLPAVQEFVFYDPPTIELSAEWNTKETPDFLLTGHVATRKFGYRSIIFDGFNGNFSWDGGRWYARDIQLQHRSGTLTAKAVLLPGDFRADIQSTLNPKSLMPFFPGKAGEALSEFEFTDSPEVQLSVRGPSFDLDKCVTTGQLRLGRSSLRDSPMDRAECNLLVKDRAVTYQNFQIIRGDGMATGSFTYDFAKHEIRLDRIKCSLNPQDVAPWINPDIVKNVAPYRFKGRPDLFLNGVVQFAGGKKTNLEIDVNAPAGMDYTFLKKNLPFNRISGHLLFTDGHLQLSNVNGALLDGTIAGNAEISLNRNAPDHSATIQVKNIDFEKATKLYFDYDNSHGQMSGNYAFTMKASDPRTMEGSGQLTVINGNIFAIPFLGPFTGILNSIIPGTGYDVARKATANFTISEGAISTKNFLVEGKGFSMLGKGKLFFLDDKIDFDIRINAQGLTGVILNPVSRLFEYTSDGSLSKPVWRPKMLPSL